MLNKESKKEIREHLEKAQNPVFFFDNDQDGLCSFLLLQRFIGRGNGIAVKSFPEMTVDYFRRVLELNADYIFIF
jgi:single-stranded DNA-specific DHH superfamily exonuclease